MPFLDNVITNSMSHISVQQLEQKQEPDSESLSSEEHDEGKTCVSNYNLYSITVCWIIWSLEPPLTVQSLEENTAGLSENTASSPSDPENVSLHLSYAMHPQCSK